jgi:hypothetical protein
VRRVSVSRDSGASGVPSITTVCARCHGSVSCEIERKNATPHVPSTCNDESGSKLPHSRSHLPRLEPDRGEFFEEEMKARVERASEKRS